MMTDSGKNCLEKGSPDIQGLKELKQNRAQTVFQLRLLMLLKTLFIILFQTQLKIIFILLLLKKVNQSLQQQILLKSQLQFLNQLNEASLKV